MSWRSSGLIGGLALASLVAGCGGSDDKPSKPPDGEQTSAGDAPTWYQDVQPILHRKCGSCHKPGAIAPFSVMDYESAKPFAALMVSAIEDGRMPPFSARSTPECTPRYPYANDPRLSPEELDKVKGWAKGGTPLGDTLTAAALVEPPPVAIERADVVMKLPEPIVVEDTGEGDLHTCLIVDPKIEKDGYVVSRQVTSGNEKVLHHVTTYIVRQEKADGTAITREEMDAAFMSAKGAKVGGRYKCFGGPTLDATGLGYSLLGSWAPGGGPVTSPPDSGQPVKKGSVVVLDLHYHPLPSGREVDADTSYALQFADKTPKYIATPIFVGFADAKQKVHDEGEFGVSDLKLQPGETTPEFVIPPNVKDHVEEFSVKWKLPRSPLKIYFASSHMHYVGRDQMVRLENAKPVDGETAMECLEHTPSWDFNWQMGYTWDTTYDKLPTIHDGDTVHVRCVYDNTLGNRFIRDALELQGKSEPVEVRVGEDTLDEMCLSLMGISYPNIAYIQETGMTP